MIKLVSYYNSDKIKISKSLTRSILISIYVHTIILSYIISQEVIQYRKEYQRTEDRREFDLNDPDYKKKDKPSRVGTSHCTGM